MRMLIVVVAVAVLAGCGWKRQDTTEEQAHLDEAQCQARAAELTVTMVGTAQGMREAELTHDCMKRKGYMVGP
jgi:outer membrane lipopolysaccharide assembly protein LptE/RlpB